MNKKKVLWIVVLILFIGAIVAIVKIANSKNSTNDANVVDNTYNKNSNAVIEETTDQEIEYQKTELEIEGMYLENLPWTFVGRYSTSNVCVYCPEGYSYFEYQLKGKIDREFTAKDDWIKIIGTLAKGNDETSDYQDYYYLEVLSIEIMNERGLDTVTN